MPEIERSPWNLVAMLGTCLTLMACAGGRPARRQYAWSTDTVTNTCMKNPVQCPPGVAGSVSAGSSVASGAPVGAAVVGGVLVRLGRVLRQKEIDAINEALAKCADDARSEVMLKHFKNRGPTREECEEVVGEDRNGEPITRAMRLGVEQHEKALQCAEKALSQVKPGGFALQPRYSFNPQTGRTEYIPPEKVKELLRQGRGRELKGTIEPDIVIHEGHPSLVQDTYDFKFPCVNTDRKSPWREYAEGHPHGGRNQGAVYRDAFGRAPARVQPRLGVFR